MLRSEKPYPLLGLDMAGSIQKAWENGWLNDYSDAHFLIKAIENRLDHYPQLFRSPAIQTTIYPITLDNFQSNFCINLSFKIMKLISIFGEKGICRFITDQLSAGKDNYDENQFFRALSEISILNYLGMNASSGQYEPQINGKKNPEARLLYKNGITVDIEVKTPGFRDFSGIKDIVIPTVLLDYEGRFEFKKYCNSHGLNGAMPRVMKIKDFLNSAAEKFEDVDHIHHLNLLYINWSLSEFKESGFQEAFSLMANQINGILLYKKIGLNLGVHEEVYDKITAVIVYTETLHGLMFGDFRWVWVRGHDGQPQFGIICMHDTRNIYNITGMNPHAKQLTPIITGIFRDTSCLPDLMDIIAKHMIGPA